MDTACGCCGRQGVRRVRNHPIHTAVFCYICTRQTERVQQTQKEGNHHIGVIPDGFVKLLGAFSAILPAFCESFRCNCAEDVV